METSSTPLTPELALLFHQSTHGPGVLITRHPVTLNDGYPSIGAGSYLDVDDQRAVMDLLTTNTMGNLDQLLPANMLVSTADKLIWQIPAAVRKMHFKVQGVVASLTVPWPNLIIKVTPGSIAVVAVAHKARAGADTPLYHAPLMNIDEGGVLCTGSARCPDNRQLASMPQWESVLFDSYFTHVNYRSTFRAFAKNVNKDDFAHLKCWQEIEKKGLTRFPTSMLLPMDLTLGDWI